MCRRARRSRAAVASVAARAQAALDRARSNDIEERKMGGAPNPALAYHEYLGPAIFVPMSRVTLAAAKPKQGERVLEVACGSGILTSQLPPLVGGTGKVV